MPRIEEKATLASRVVKVKWIDGMRFVATDSRGHSIVMDASKQAGREGSGFSPPRTASGDVRRLHRYRHRRYHAKAERERRGSRDSRFWKAS